MEAPEFVNREREIGELKTVLTGRPSFVYFVYGPINSGKTALLMRVLEELPEDYRVFYINFRGFEGGYSKFTRAFFELGDKNLWERIKGNLPLVAAAVEYVEKVAKKINTAIELPAEVIAKLQVGEEEPEKIDMFHYLERVMDRFASRGKRPVLVFDEMQVLEGELNAAGQPLLARLFNFLVRLTKEKHLCHCLCATSDCLFIEQIYSNARLEGRAKYMLVDDLPKEEAFKAYEAFGFEDKELVWEYIGGKLGDMVSLFEEKRRGYPEKEALRRMLGSETARLRDFLEAVEDGERDSVDAKGIVEALEKLKEGEIEATRIPRRVRRFLIQENVLFYDPLKGTVKPQSKLLWKAIKEVTHGLHSSL